MSNIEESSSLAYTETTGDIRVTVFPEYLAEHSDPDSRIYSFAYTINIDNLGGSSAQLLERHWVVTSGGSFFTEVKGDGVVGVKPKMLPGESFQYTSGCVITDPMGTMHGKYLFQDENGDLFEVHIPQFDLLCPWMIH